MNTLLINTATPEAWVAVAVNEEIRAEQRWTADHGLGQELLVAIDRVLGEAQVAVTTIDQVAVHHGPGHYSALRTGIVTAALLAQALPTSLLHFATADLQQALSTMLPVAPGDTIVPHYT